jgi:hypothetical protein
MGQIAPLFKEDFEGLVLGPNVDEALAGDAVWTKTPPAGWTIDDSGVPGAGTDNDGVTEWAGWSFASREWWAQTAGGQRRSEFTKGVGTVAIADGDEWDDAGHEPGTINTFLRTVDIVITGQAANSLALRFNSSWRPEPVQKANITVSYDGAAPVEVLRFESDETSPFFKDDSSTNDELTVPLNNPAGASKLALTFGYFDAGNNWFWAVDNIQILGFENRVPAEPTDIVISITRTDTGLSLAWNGGGALETAPAVTGSWSTVAGATSPYPVQPTGTAAFYRIKQP